MVKKWISLVEVYLIKNKYPKKVKNFKPSLKMFANNDHVNVSSIH